MSALHPCNDCGQAVSHSAKTCPHCGSRNPHPLNWLWIGFAIVVILVCLCMAWG